MKDNFGRIPEERSVIFRHVPRRGLQLCCNTSVAAQL